MRTLCRLCGHVFHLKTDHTGRCRLPYCDECRQVIIGFTDDDDPPPAPTPPQSPPGRRNG